MTARRLTYGEFEIFQSQIYAQRREIEELANMVENPFNQLIRHCRIGAVIWKPILSAVDSVNC